MKKLSTILCTLALLFGAVGGVNSVRAEKVQLRSTGFTETVGGNCSYDNDTKTFSWSSQYSNAVTVIKFNAGLLPYFSKVKLHVDDIKDGGEFRIIVNFNTAQYWQTISSTGDISLDITNFQKWGTKITDEEIANAIEIRLSGSDGEAHVGDWVKIDPTSIYLETSWDAPMQIATTDDWVGFSIFISSGITNLNATLTADVDAGSTMVGTSSNPYTGTFDGSGHTLTFNYDGSTSNEIAPFQYINSATINNLTTTGSINAQNIFGGIVGTAGGNSTLNYCTSSMALTANDNGDSNNGRVAGFVGRCADNATPIGTSVTFNNCIFDGSISSTQGSRCCGLVSWARSTTVTANNCLIAATKVTNGAENIAATGGTNPTVTPTNCYYTKRFGYSSQGTAATDVEIASGKLCYLLNGSSVPSSSYFFGQGKLNSSIVEDIPSLTSNASKKVLRLYGDENADHGYANPNGMLPDPANYGKLAWKLAWAFDDASYTNYLSSDKTADCQTWCFSEKYLLTVGSARTTTLVLPFYVPKGKMPSGVKAYKLEYTSGDVAIATEVEEISPDKPVLIKAEAGNYLFESSFAWNADINFSTHTSTTNEALTGVYNTTMPFSYVPADAYVLQNGDEGLGFYRVENANTIKITSFRAYLTPQSGSNARCLKIEYADESTDIQEVKTSGSEDLKSEEYYNLSGQRVSKPTKGLYIVNGKKVAIK